jgi:hypothetical protein
MSRERGDPATSHNLSTHRLASYEREISGRGTAPYVLPSDDGVGQKSEYRHEIPGI